MPEVHVVGAFTTVFGRRVSMARELVTQLRGEACTRQVEGATLGLQENGCGIIGLDEALAAVAIYERVR